MAITYLSLAHSSDNVDRTAYTIPSLTVGADKLILLLLVTNNINSVPSSITGTLGLTWTEITNVSNTAANRKSTCYRALSGAGATGTIIANLAAEANGCQWAVVEVTGSKLTGTNGSDAIVQSPTNNSASTNALTVNLNAFADAVNNGVVGWFNCMRTPVTWTAQTGTALSDTTNTSPSESTMVETGTGEDTTVSASTGGTSVAWEAIALEIAMATGGGGGGGGVGSLLARTRNRLVVTP